MLLDKIYDIIWSPALVVLLVCSGLYFTIRTRFVQIRLVPKMIALLFPFHYSKQRRKGKGISSFEAFCVSLSGRVGTGNIVGVATAIGVGGPGAVFWMWIVAIFGAATAFVESTLSQMYRFQYKGVWRGGPFVYMEEALHCRWLGIIFALAILIGSSLFCTTVQTNGMAVALDNTFDVAPLWSGIALALLVGVVIIGGIKWISKASAVITPIMTVGYILLALIVIVINWRNIPAAFGCIFTNAFGINPLCGGIIGSTIAMGVKRGLFSNEAGQGTGAIPSASATVSHPAEQGLAQAFSVYIDTLFICTATALMIIVTGQFNIVDPATDEILFASAPELGNNYVLFTQSALDTVFGGMGGFFVSIALIFFVFTTMMAYYFYGESSIVYLCRRNNGSMAKVLTWIFRGIFLAAIVFGTLKEADTVWTLGDIGVGIMAWLNVITILILSPVAFRALREYEKKL